MRFVEEVQKPLFYGMTTAAELFGQGYDEAYEALELLELAEKELASNIFATATRYDAAKNDRPAAFMTQALASLDQLIALGPLPK
mmetsp:Transcript_854/g.1511  ORF Transcript_854/g.1511 Transcript_854/m.1511 type:complete len:85 (-) Transcript_854:312-566(-)